MADEKLGVAIELSPESLL